MNHVVTCVPKNAYTLGWRVHLSKQTQNIDQVVFNYVSLNMGHTYYDIIILIVRQMYGISGTQMSVTEMIDAGVPRALLH